MTTAMIEELMDKPNYHRPYGVHVGDMVWLWKKGAPPLSEEYIKPDCVQALVIAFRSGFPPDFPDANYQVWLADLAYVEESGSIKILTNVPQVESSASTQSMKRSYGTWQSWHRQIIHDSETATQAVIVDINDVEQIDKLSESLRNAIKRDGTHPFLYNETVRACLMRLGVKRYTDNAGS